MHWIQILFEVEKSIAIQLEEALVAQDALAVTLSDAADQPLFEPELGATPLWEAIRVMGLFDATTPTETITQSLRTHFGSSLPQYKVEILEDKDWIKEWMDQYKPIQFTDKLWICPTWLEPPDASAANIMLDPGMAFGTGTHATTALCLTWLGKLALSGKSLIDYGCGSGILAVGAYLLGCSKLFAVDIDPQALQATANNAQQNHIPEACIGICLPQDLSTEPVDILIANILAGPLINLAPTLEQLVQTNGKLALSGILTSQTEQVITAYQPWFTFAPVVEKDGWVLLSGVKTS